MDEDKQRIELTTTGTHGFRKGDVVSVTRITRVVGWNRLLNPRFWFKPYRQLESKDTITSSSGMTITLRKWEGGK